MSLLLGTLVLALLGGLGALLLGFAERRYSADDNTVVALINQRLPQTQCAQCGYPGCRPYAEAVAKGEAINKCPPGGAALVQNLANLLGRETVPLDPACGPSHPPRVAVIREAECIGCTLCIAACPVDAIVGAPQLLHSVISADCTGCDLCLEPCPVDCIDMLPVAAQVITPLRLPRIQQDALDLVQYACIHCGLCEPACPRDLAPQALFWHRQEPERLQALNLNNCIECRLCDRVCPSNIPLTAAFQSAKQHQRQLDSQAQQASLAQARFEQHEQRLSQAQARISSRPSKGAAQSLIDALRKNKL